MAKPTNSRNSLCAQDWVDAASELLASDGIDAVRIEPLARKLTVTKGSFYWHFSNRNELLEEVLNGWRKRATSAVIERINSSNLPPIERLSELFLFPKHGNQAQQAAHLETAIRQWAKKDSTAKVALDEVDERRIGFITDIFSELDYSAQEAEIKAIFFYCTLHGMANISGIISEEVLENGKNMLLEETRGKSK